MAVDDSKNGEMQYDDSRANIPNFGTIQKHAMQALSPTIAFHSSTQWRIPREHIWCTFSMKRLPEEFQDLSSGYSSLEGEAHRKRFRNLTCLKMPV